MNQNDPLGVQATMNRIAELEGQKFGMGSDAAYQLGQKTAAIDAEINRLRTLIAASIDTATRPTAVATPEPVAPAPRKPRGRPKGSKNVKSKASVEAKPNGPEAPAS